MMVKRTGLVLALLATAALSACGSTPVASTAGNYAQPIGGAPVTANPTDYSSALVCLNQYARSNRIVAPRIAVGRIADYTGKEESDGSGRKVTQGASLMAVSAFAKAGMPLVERFDTSVSEFELKYANNKLISDRPNPAPEVPADYRKILAGQVPGSDFYVIGGITELNYNISSSGLDARGGDVGTAGLKASLTTGKFVINVAIDLRLIDTRSQEVVDITSYQKQIVGREIKAGIFDFLNGNVFDISGGKSALEPIQLAVRTLVERSVYDFAASLRQQPYEQCMGDDAKASRAQQAKRPNKSSAVAAAPSRPVSTPSPAQAAPQGPAYGGPYLDRSRWVPKS